MSEYQWSDPSVTVFVIIPVILAALFVFGVWQAWRRTGQSPAAARRAVMISIFGVAAWMIVTAGAAQSGVLREWERTPPPFFILAFAMAVGAFSIALGPVGRRMALGLPVWGLIAVQSFRFPLELTMHRLFERQIMPIQMTYTGRNLDVVTGF